MDVCKTNAYENRLTKMQGCILFRIPMPSVGGIFSSHFGRFSSCRGGKRRKGEKKGEKRKKKEERDKKDKQKEKGMKGKKKGGKNGKFFKMNDGKFFKMNGTIYIPESNIEN